MKKLILAVATLVTISTSAFAQLGSADKDLVYTPVTPCRIFDTRPSQGGTGAIAAAGTKNFVIWGQTSYAAQGGKNTNCGITAGSDTAAVAINVTVVTPAAGGFVTAYPFGAHLPTAATVNFQVGDIARGNFTIAKVNQAGASSDLSVYSTSLVDVAGDVVGYYSKPMATALQCEDTTPVSALINTAFGSVFTATLTATACSAGFTQVALRCYTSSSSSNANEMNGGGCGGNNSQIATTYLYASRRCCRIPGR